ncbi:3-methyl-2-oxobutanoate hydroxymethyltransferase [Pleomorphochaeta sp. DL1XJH-081]|jgi:3-methyl-2-oxobutanoate hydroxymethyltransferase|uniref:3-methyl-2-oxobutanoate hydroxymethyltransferase n=1 Tax=Pleomorphochaeta sp. DL1XJH-081 TaxID=3409690 RepID=UPI003BB63401
MDTTQKKDGVKNSITLTAPGFIKRKKTHQKISMVTCYDAAFAKIITKTDIDCVLVGDSCAMVVYGEKTTIPATINMMRDHTKAVRNGLPNKFLVADMPFLSFRKGIPSAVEAAGELMQAGADAVKIEGLTGHEDTITHLIHSGIPVMGHLGLTPQFYHSLGGYKVQGREIQAAQDIKSQALKLEELGCFSLVLECIPEYLGGEIARSLTIPVIGIGAGREVDGQVLVLHDLLGLSDTKTTFVRQYISGADLVANALNSYCSDISDGSFPSESEVFSV